MLLRFSYIGRRNELKLLAKTLETPIDCKQKGVIDQVYQRFGKAALSKLCHVVGREDIARELLQEVFVKLWQKSPIFDSEQMLYGWIYRSCHNSGIDYLRSAVFRRESGALVSETERPDEQIDIEGALLGREAVRGVMSKLGARDAQILGYVAIDEMTHEEAAQVLGVSKKTVTRTMIRIREELVQGRQSHG